MMPGMIEVHAHLVIVGHGDYEHWFKWLEDHHRDYPLERVMELSARQLLSAGITSASSTGPTQPDFHLCPAVAGADRLYVSPIRVTGVKPSI
jgi:imidazolonepropionase-like amidohydrolase